MNIVYASDDNFAEVMGVSMASLFENNRDADTLEIFVLDNQISGENKEKLTRLAGAYRRNIHILPMPDMHELAGVRLLPKRVPLSSLSRLFLPLLMPTDIDKLLYIDCDTLVRGSLAACYDTCVDGVCGAGVMDCVSKEHRRNIGLLPEDHYFNAGILLINLKKWRESAVFHELIDFIISYGGNVPYEDQGVINGVIGRDMRVLSPVYNSMTVTYDFPTYRQLRRYRKPSKYYSEAEHLEGVTSPVIVHFTTSFLSLRPWVEGCGHPYAPEWLSYRELTPWKDKPLRKDNRSYKKKAFVLGYRVLPRWVAVGVAGWMHAVVLPYSKERKRMA